MKAVTLIAALLMAGTTVAQDDPTLMTINGQPVARSEFEYSYNKNNAEGVVDKKTVEEYVDLFVNYKLKVVAALEARIDTMSAFRQEFAQYRDQQVLPMLVSDADMEAEARKVYDNTKTAIGPQGLVRPAHIFLALDQKATSEEQEAVKQRIDSIYAALKEGADFEELARNLSQDRGSAQNGGLLPWIGPKQTFKEFEDQAYALADSQMSEPFLSPAGYHIILMKGHKQLEPYDTLRANIMNFLEKRNARDRVASARIDSIVKSSNGTLTREEAVSHLADSLMVTDMNLRYLIGEYHDGLLLYEISNRCVWDKAAKDTAGLEAYFKANKAKYAWDKPRYKGMAYHVKTASDVKAVKDCVKKLPFSEWATALRTTFNSDSVLRIRVEKGIFKEGDNALIDREVFKRDTTVTPLKDYPIDAVYGKLLKKGPEEYSDVRGLVAADYQDELERKWVDELRRKYEVSIDENVLRTVNKH